LSPTAARRTRGSRLGDVVAGATVALVLIPQALAYADLAGMPPVHGLYVAATAPVLAAPFVSSRYLQTGPVALTALLTLGALGTLAAPYSPSYVGLAALLAVVVGTVRLLVGLFRLGAVAWLMSQPVLRGFTLAAALLIASSQIPASLGAAVHGTGVLARAGAALADPAGWTLGAVALSAATVALMKGGSRLHPLFPGVLVASLLGLVASTRGLAVGPTIGDVPGQLPPFSLDLPWGQIGRLVLPGIVIAVVGFAEPAAIARTFASQDRQRWDPDREFVSQGVANLAAGVFSGFPVGGSFSRSSLSRVAGATSGLAGAVTGLVVLAVLPFAYVLAPLPRAVLGATVLGAMVSLADPRPLLRMWSLSKPQASIGWLTFATTLLSAPHVEYGVLFGIAASLGLHLWREMRMQIALEVVGDTLIIRPYGVLWFGTAALLEQRLNDALADHDGDKVVLDLGGLGRIDYTGADALWALVTHTRAGGTEVTLTEVPPQAERIMGRFGIPKEG
jgi:SulP family sulfate permease